MQMLNGSLEDVKGAGSIWYESVWFDLAIAVVAGFLYALLVMGPRPLNPRNVNWMSVDPASYYIGWELFRQDPHLHWPLTYTDRLGYPVGESVALLDVNPLLVLVLKPLSPLLPEPFQYFGIEVILACTLQFFFAFRLLRLLLGSNLLGVALCSVFFLLAPPLNLRFRSHYTLTNQWLLLAALFVFAQAQQQSSRSTRRFVFATATLAAVSVGINPYLAFQVLLILTAAVASLLWQKRITLSQSAGIMGLLAAISFVMSYSVGLVIRGGRGYGGAGYRHYSMNLLSLFDPRDWKSVLLPKLPETADRLQYEGYNYLGAGVLLLAAVVVVAALIHRGKVWRPDKGWLGPLSLCCLLLTLLALSTKVTLGARTLVDLDPRAALSPYLAPLRSSGRLFWTPYYAILAGILAAPFLLFRRTWANLLIAGMLVLQFADTSALRHRVHTTIIEQHPSPLKSPIWSELGTLHQNLIVLPAWQCDGGNTSPGGPDGYRVFGFLAIQQRMRINSYQSGRYPGVAMDFHCYQSIAALARQPLSPDSAYIVSPELAALVARGPTGPGKCHDLDNFILCSSKTDFGLSPVLMNPAH
jgi:hypothetical protein